MTIWWTKKLHSMLYESSVPDEEIIEFISEQVNAEEGKLIDYKRRILWKKSNTNDQKANRSDFLKSVCAFSNTIHESQYRYLVTGFSDDGGFVGSWSGENEKEITQVDESAIQDVISEYLEPTPDVDRYKLEQEENEASIFVIERSDMKPVMTSNEINIESNSGGINKNSAFTRSGSSNREMSHNDFRKLIQRREEMFSQAFQEVADDLQRVVGIPSSQLEELNLSAAPNEDGVPVREVLSVDPISEPDSQLTVLTKNWNSTGELASDRNTIYHFYRRREDIDMTQPKVEFLIESCLQNYFPGYYWINAHRDMESDTKDVFFDFIEKFSNGNNIGCVENVLLAMDYEEVLKYIDENIEYKQNAGDYLSICGDPAKRRLSELSTRKTVEFDGNTYKLSEIATGNTDGKAVLEEALNQVLNEDSGNNRAILRAVELSMLTYKSY
jgi:hypothetical protein